jgi:hypothetical protein
MLRSPHVRFSQFWPSLVVLVALLGVVAEIQRVRQTRPLSQPRSGVESILHFQHLTYVATPHGEPRQLPIELVDRGLPLALQENYSAQVSSYHPARAKEYGRELLPPPAELQFPAADGPEPILYHDRMSQEERSPENGSRTLQLFAPGGWAENQDEPQAAPGSQDPLDGVEPDDEALLRLIPSDYPGRNGGFSRVPFSSEIRSSYVTEEEQSPREDQPAGGRVEPTANREVSGATIVPRLVPPPQLASPARHGTADASPSGGSQPATDDSLPAKLFPAPPNAADVRRDHMGNAYWSPTKWTRSSASNSPTTSPR